MYENKTCMITNKLINTIRYKAYPRKKMSRYFGDISPKYRVSKDIDTIFHGEISVRWYFRINRDISAILVINQQFFPIYRMVNAGQRSQMCYSAVNELLQCASHLLPRGFSHLPSGLTSPLIYNVQTIYIYT